MAGRDRLQLPPSSVTGEVGDYFQAIWKAINEIPTLSFFSGTHPNSSLTGIAGNLAVNISPSSAVSRLFLKYGSAALPDRDSWNTVA